MSEIGEKLKNARVEKGYTLDDLQQITKIQKRYLIAIEEGRFEALPGAFYIKAFVRQYAETVDLNPQELLAELNAELGQGAPTEPVKQNEAVTRTAILREKQKTSQPSKLERFLSYLPTIIIVSVVIAILGSIYIVAWGNHQKNADQPIDVSSAKVEKTSDGSTTPKKKKSSSKAAKSSVTSRKQKITYISGTTYTYQLKNGAKKNKITLKATNGAAWNAVTVDGTQVWQGTLTSGSTHTVTVPADATKIKLSIGNSKATSLTINGQEFNYKKQGNGETVRTLIINVGKAA